MNKRLGLDEKLDVLQASDTYRKWYSLDDQRVCILCEKLINGRMIDIWQDQEGTYLLHCPTPGCSGSPRDWFYCGFRAAGRPKVMQQPRTHLQLEFLRQTDSRRVPVNIEDAERVSVRRENHAH
jgi:hypothetical protein